MICGILLAAGASRRFGRDKLLQPLADGLPIGVAAVRHLLPAVDRVMAVVRPDAQSLAERLRAEGASVVPCPAADQGMGVSLAWGVKASLDSDGWLVALADMPFIRPETYREGARLLREGALLAAPVYRGKRGHPVGFSRVFGQDLCKLQGDIGAREIVQAHAARLVLWPTDDPGVIQDIDVPEDLPS